MSKQKNKYNNISCTFSEIPPQFKEALLTDTQKETIEIYYHIYTIAKDEPDKQDVFIKLSESLFYSFGHVYRTFYETKRKIKGIRLPIRYRYKVKKKDINQLSIKFLEFDY